MSLPMQSDSATAVYVELSCCRWHDHVCHSMFYATMRLYGFHPSHTKQSAECIRSLCD